MSLKKKRGRNMKKVIAMLLGLAIVTSSRAGLTRGSEEAEKGQLGAEKSQLGARMNTATGIDVRPQMAKYNRHTCEDYITGTVYYPGTSVTTTGFTIVDMEDQCTEMYFSNSTGYSVGGPKQTHSWKPVYRMDGENLIELWVDFPDKGGRINMKKTTTPTKVVTWGKRCGSYLAQVRVRKGDLPADGLHSDGYWYKYSHDYWDYGYQP